MQQLLLILVASIVIPAFNGCGSTALQVRTMESFAKSTEKLGTFLEEDMASLSQAVLVLQLTNVALSQGVPISHGQLEEALKNERSAIDGLQTYGRFIKAYAELGKSLVMDKDVIVEKKVEELRACLLQVIRIRLTNPVFFSPEIAKHYELPSNPHQINESSLENAMEGARKQHETYWKTALLFRDQIRLRLYATNIAQEFEGLPRAARLALNSIELRWEEAAEMARKLTWERINNPSTEPLLRLGAVDLFVKAREALTLKAKFANSIVSLTEEVEKSSIELLISANDPTYSLQDVERFIDRMDEMVKQIDKLISLIKRVTLLFIPVI